MTTKETAQQEVTEQSKSRSAVEVEAVPSWQDQDELKVLAETYREASHVEGVIRTVGYMSLESDRAPGGSYDEDVFVVSLPNGITGYCPSSEFRERSFKRQDQFIGISESFKIIAINLDKKLLILSERKAAEHSRKGFWKTLKELQQTDALDTKTFNARVTGYNMETRTIYTRVEGQEAFMRAAEWDFPERGPIDAYRGEKIEVKVLRFDEERKLVQVSRKAALTDPFDHVKHLKKGQIIAGKVIEVNSVHGMFVEIENGVVLKAQKVSALAEPMIGDIVSCTVRHIDFENRRGKVLITDYPRGQRKKKDIGAFLFE